MSAPDLDDLLDAGCEPGLAQAFRVADGDAPYLALFADLLDREGEGDPAALEERACEWRELFA